MMETIYKKFQSAVKINCDKIFVNYDGISTTSFNPSLIKKPDANSNLLLQNLVDSAYQDFLDLVSKGRALDRTYTDSISQGKVWDANNVSIVEKAIRESNLGLNPMTEGNLIRVPILSLIHI